MKDKMKLWWGRMRRFRYTKYITVVVIGMLFVGFLDENSMLAHLRNNERINELSEEIERYNLAYRRDQAQIRELQRNPKAIEKIARERYFMKADDEDIFILSDDNTTDREPGNNHEAAE